MRTLPNELFTELTYATIQKDAMWMEYDPEMQDFSLIEYIEEDIVKNANVFLCGYFPVLKMEMAMISIGKEQGLFYSIIRDGKSKAQSEEFKISDRKDDFCICMLMYAASNQIVLREQEQSYRNVVAELTQAKSAGCAGCSGCVPK